MKAKAFLSELMRSKMWFTGSSKRSTPRSANVFEKETRQANNPSDFMGSNLNRELQMPPRKEKPMTYYKFQMDLGRAAAGWELINGDRLQVGSGRWGLSNWKAWPDGYLVLPRGPWCIPHYDETPTFLVDRKLGPPPRDIVRWDDFLLVSKALKDVIETVAPGSCEFLRCETVTRTGEPWRETWLCSATTVFPGAVDREASRGLLWRRGPGGVENFSPIGGPSMDVRFRHEIIGSAHLFRLAEHSIIFICDEIFKDACKQAGIKGASFLPFGH